MNNLKLINKKKEIMMMVLMLRRNQVRDTLKLDKKQKLLIKEMNKFMSKFNIIKDSQKN